VSEKWNIGIDIGGTKINIGIVSDRGCVLDSVIIPSDYKDQHELFVDNVYNKTQELLQRNNMTLESISFIGIGVPGTIEIKTGFVNYCPNLFWVDVPIGKIIEQKFKRKISMGQDVRLAALAELLFGAGIGFTDILCVVVGTGIGCGIIIGGKIFSGAMNTAGEIGHMIFEKNGRQCTCGTKGCLERYASGTGIIERALEVLDEESFDGRSRKSETVFELAQEGNEIALKLIDDCVSDLAVGITNSVDLLSPQAVIIGGGLCEHEELFFNPLKKYVVDHGYFSWTKRNELQICKAKLGSDAAMIGAAMLFRGM